MDVFDAEDECEADDDGECSSIRTESNEDTTAATSTISLHSEVVPTCPWIEVPADRIAKLELPESSNDLLIEPSLLFDALEVYETCRSYYRSVHISPFLFEDFCAALRSDEQSNLLAEMHISLLKLALKDDEEEQIVLSVQDTNNSFNILLQLIEPMTYAEVLRQYVESDPVRFPKHVIEALNGNYPFTGVRPRLTVLSWLCDRFLQSREYKNIVRNEGRLSSDEHCRECGKPGDVLLCDGCEACYHLHCAQLNKVPDGQWLCQICKIHKVHGVTDCEPTPNRSNKQPLRMTPLGYDRHGRRYWQDDRDGSIVYYSTLPQLYNLLKQFDIYDFERQLNTNISEILPLIAEQMHITIELTMKRAAKIRNSGEPYLIADNLVSRRDQEDVGRAVASLSDNREVQKKAVGYRLGESYSYKNYVNQYSINDYAKTPYLRAKERDKKKYLCGRFSLADEGAFEWTVPEGQSVFGTAASVCVIIQKSLLKLSKKIPLTLMHRLWKKEGLDRFQRALTTLGSVESLRDNLLRFECAMRKPLLTNVWWGTLGHTRLTRSTAEDREAKQKVDAKKKKQDRMLMVADMDDDDSNIIWVKYTKVGGPPRHSLWRQKDEQYRVNGRGALGGWIWLSSTLRRKFLALAQKPPFGITSATPELELTSLAARKAFSLECLVQKFTRWRNIQQKTTQRKAHRTLMRNCYSPSCRQGLLPIPIDESHSKEALQQCYSVICREASAASAEPITGIVHASDPFVSSIRKMRDDSEIEGEGKPFPLPVPFNFRVRSTGQQSILVLPQRALKHLARQGGLNSNFFAPGFHRIAKSNPHVWNYPCQRPLFDHCWRYLTLRSPSYHAVALSLRVLYACIRWADMERDEDDATFKLTAFFQDVHVTVHFPDHDEVRTVIGHKEWPPDGFYEQYKLRVQLIPLDDSNGAGDDVDEDSDVYRPGRASDGRSSRRRKTTFKAKLAGVNGAQKRDETKVIEKWIDGVELKLWEIADYWRRMESTTRKVNSLMPPPTSVTVFVEPIIVRYDPAKLTGLGDTQYSPALSRTALRRRIRPNHYEDYEYGDFGDEYVDVESCETSRKFVYERHVDPFKADSRKPNRHSSEDDFENTPCRIYKRSWDGVAGGGKFTLMQQQGDGQKLHRVVLCPSEPPQVARSADTPRLLANASPIDEPPIIPRYDNNTAMMSSSTTTTTQRTIYTTPSQQSSSTNRTASRVLVIRRADGSTHLIRPVAQSTTRDSQGNLRTLITTTKAGGTTMSDVRNTATPSVSEASPQQATTSANIIQQRRYVNGSLTDHAGMAQSRRMISAMRTGKAVLLSGQPARLTSVGSQSAGAAQATSTPSSAVYIRGVRRGVASSQIANIAERDPFMKRMAAEKAISGTPTICANGPTAATRRSTGNTYAGYYGENSNDRIDVEEYQMLAEQGYRPPGRPPGRLTSSFGYGPRVSQHRSYLQGNMRTVNVAQRDEQTAVTAAYRATTAPAATTVIGTDFCPVIKYETVGQYRQSLQHQMEAARIDHTSGGAQMLGSQMRNVTTYKEYCMRRGIEPKDRHRLPGGVRFNFESNEDEERAIAEAIAHEEEIMRMEEEGKGDSSAVDYQTDTRRCNDDLLSKHLVMRNEADSFHVSTSREDQPLNLTINKDDPPDLVVCKQLLTVMVMQVCKWDYHYGWHKALLKRANEDGAVDSVHRTVKARRQYNIQNNVDLGERIDRYKKEVNKRRVKLEANAELEAGMVTPWRRPRGRPNKIGKRVSSTSAASVPTSVGVPVDPSEISLGTSNTQWPQVKIEEQQQFIINRLGNMRLMSMIFNETYILQSGESESVQAAPQSSHLSVKDDEKSYLKASIKEETCSVSSSYDANAQLRSVQTTSSNRSIAKTTTAATPSAVQAPSPNTSPATSREDRKKLKRKREPSSSDDEKTCSSPQSSRQRGRPRKEAKQELNEEPSVVITSKMRVKERCRDDSPHEIDPSARHCFTSPVTCAIDGSMENVLEYQNENRKKCQVGRVKNAPKNRRKVNRNYTVFVKRPMMIHVFTLDVMGAKAGSIPNVSASRKRIEAEKAAQYLCPACVQNTQSGYESGTSTTSSATRTLGRADYPLLWRLLETLTEHRTSWPFRQKVDPLKYPNYYKIIKKPMDLGLVQNKIERLEYDRLKDFSADVTQIFENARTYNSRESAIHQCADILEQHFREHLLEVKEQIEGRNRERNQASESRTVDSSLDIDTDQLLNTGETVDPSVFNDII
ncbi:unnamed protein product [Anisakis simplex]|uniref:Uncharacterized protein n=1 Tax=Anisakis simplex TaxID=6269 RepID=A0A3P6RF46_ANISI|nr:unnamed protein product [Anisakis simplex]